MPTVPQTCQGGRSGPGRLHTRCAGLLGCAAVYWVAAGAFGLAFVPRYWYFELGGPQRVTKNSQMPSVGRSVGREAMGNPTSDDGEKKPAACTAAGAAGRKSDDDVELPFDEEGHDMQASATAAAAPALVTTSKRKPRWKSRKEKREKRREQIQQEIDRSSSEDDAENEDDGGGGEEKKSEGGSRKRQAEPKMKVPTRRTGHVYRDEDYDDENGGDDIPEEDSFARLERQAQEKRAANERELVKGKKSRDRGRGSGGGGSGGKPPIPPIPHAIDVMEAHPKTVAATSKKKKKKSRSGDASNDQPTAPLEFPQSRSVDFRAWAWILRGARLHHL